MSPHFTLAELTFTGTGLPNEPGPGARLYLMELASVLLEPLREIAGCPLVITSGYRSPEVNAAVGGAPDSAHLDGRAADLHPESMTARDLFDRIRSAKPGDHDWLPYDLAIFEQRGAEGVPWLHIQLPRKGAAPRHRALVFTPETHGRYLPA